MSGASSGIPRAAYYLVNGIMTLFFAAILFALVPWIRRRMASVEIQAPDAVPAAH
jgi:POT family proton-dependent oligopeptide transporter